MVCWAIVTGRLGAELFYLHKSFQRVLYKAIVYDDTSHYTTIRHTIRRYVTLYDDTSHYTTIRHTIRRYVTLYDDTSHYTTIRHNICPKTVLYFCKRTVLKVLCYQNIYAEKHGTCRNVHVYKFIGDRHSE